MLLGRDLRNQYKIPKNSILIPICQLNQLFSNSEAGMLSISMDRLTFSLACESRHGCLYLYLYFHVCHCLQPILHLYREWGIIGQTHTYICLRVPARLFLSRNEVPCCCSKFQLNKLVRRRLWDQISISSTWGGYCGERAEFDWHTHTR